MTEIDVTDWTSREVALKGEILCWKGIDCSLECRNIKVFLVWEE